MPAQMHTAKNIRDETEVRILLTGFLPLDGFPSNTSAVVVRNFSKGYQCTPCRFSLKKIVSPVKKTAYRLLIVEIKRL